MLEACYPPGMSALQVKNVPEDVHEYLRSRAEADGTTISEVVLTALRREMARPRMRDWLDRVADSTPTKATGESIVKAIREGRAEH